MRRIQSLFKTLLMLIPMTAVPVMAIFGIPQLFTVSASPFERPEETGRFGALSERRVGQSDALQVQHIDIEPSRSLDLFQPYADGRHIIGPENSSVVANAASSQSSRQRNVWQDPLAGLKDAPSPGRQHVREVALMSEPRSSTASPRSRRQSHNAARSEPMSSFSGQAAIPPQTSAAAAPPGTERRDVASADYSSGAAGSFRRVEKTMAPEVASSGRYSRQAVGDQFADPTPDDAIAETITWREAVDRLNDLGIRTFRLTPNSGQGGYRFVCLVTSVTDPRISRRFESESPDPLVAVSNVLAQVEDWNLHQ